MEGWEGETVGVVWAGEAKKGERRQTPLNPPPPSCQVLDAPALADDFYLNLVDWSAQNVLAVGLGPCVYLWSACTSKARGLGGTEGGCGPF